MRYTQHKNMGKLYLLPEDIQNIIHDFLCRTWEERTAIEYSADKWDHYLDVDWSLIYDEQFNDFDDRDFDEWFEDEERESRWGNRRDCDFFDELDKNLLHY